MGQNISNSTTIDFSKISDYSLIEIPQTYALLKISTFNVNLTDKMNTEKEIESISKYVFSKHLNKSIDILCIQGIHTNNLAVKLVEKIKSKLQKKEKLFFAPSFDNINKRNSHTFYDFAEKITMKSVNKTTSKIELQNKMKALTQNIIISTYPIIDWYFSDLDESHDADDLYGIKSVLCANIRVANKIISIYNYELNNDLNSVGVINEDIRSLELKTLNYEIRRNKNELLTNQKYSSYKLSDIHLIVGCLNINEFEKDFVKKEFIDTIKKLKGFDIYRFLNQENSGYTIKNRKERNSYIIMILDYNFTHSITFSGFTKKTAIDIIHKYYGIMFLNSAIYSIDTHQHKQIELICFLKK